MCKVSIIVPIYNVENYLVQCLDSIRSQSLKDIEIICIDDGSTDSCPEILDNYAKTDFRIKVLHKSNEGYGKAMNTGMAMATGEYIGFVESDDCINGNMYETLYYTASKYDLDFVKSDFFWYWGRLGFEIYATTLPDKRNYNRIIENNEWNIFLDAFTSHWTGIYKKTFIDQYMIRYNETPGASYQDTGFLVWVGLLFKKAMVIDQAFYKYRQDNINSSVKNPHKIMDMDYEYDYIIKKMCQYNLDNKIKYINYLKLKAQRNTLKRISNKYKLAYSKYIIDNYKAQKNNIETDIFTDRNLILDWIHSLCSEPERFCLNLIKNQDIINSYFDRSKCNLSIVGAGYYAHKVLWNLLFNNYERNITGVYVTKDFDLQSIYNVVPENISKLTYIKDVLVIIAVKENSPNYYEIVNLLQSLNITHYIGYNDILKWDI